MRTETELLNLIAIYKRMFPTTYIKLPGYISAAIELANLHTGKR